MPPPRRVDGRDGDERHQPLPGLAALPAHLLGGLPVPVRRSLVALAVLLALAAGVGALVVLPASKRLRYRLLHVAGRLAFHARAAMLRLQASWPWARYLAAAFARLKALPGPAG